MSKFKSGRIITQCHSYHGIPIDELSSVVQKSICRRGDLKTGVPYALQWMLFVKWQESDKTRKMASAALSNFRNRIFHVALFEDILAFAEIPAVVDILDKHESWFEMLKSSLNSSENSSLVSDASIHAAAKIIQSLERISKLRKYRIGSEMMQSLYTDRSSDGSEVALVSEFKNSQFRTSTSSTITRFENFIYRRLMFGSMPDKLVPLEREHLVLGIIKDMSAKSDLFVLHEKDYFTFFLYLFRSLPENKDEQCKDLILRIRELRKAFWEQIRQFTSGLGLYATNSLKSMNPVQRNMLERFSHHCRRLFMDSHESKEAYLYPLHCLLACIHHRNLVESGNSSSESSETLSTSQASEISATSETSEISTFQASLSDLVSYFNNPTPPNVPIPDYAIDMHTKAGRKRGRSRKDFALEGCQVIPCDEEYYVPSWHERYIAARCEVKEKVNVNVRQHSSESKDNNKSEVSYSSESSKSSDDSFQNPKRLKIMVNRNDSEPSEAKLPAKLSLEFMDMPDQYVQDWKNSPRRVVLCQKVTSKWKQISLLDYIHDVDVDGCPLYFYKGPFDVSKGNTLQRLQCWSMRQKLLEKLKVSFPKGTLMCEKMCEKTLDENEYHHEDNQDDSHHSLHSQKFWIRCSSLIRLPYSDVIGDVDGDHGMNTSEMCNGWSGTLMNKSKVALIRMCEASSDEILNHPDCFRMGYLYLFLRLVFNPPIGDSGSWNILIDKQSKQSQQSKQSESSWTPYCVDFEEVSHDKNVDLDLDGQNWPLFVQKRTISVDVLPAINTVLGFGSSLHHQTNLQKTIAIWNHWIDLIDEIPNNSHLFRLNLIEKIAMFFQSFVYDDK